MFEARVFLLAALQRVVDGGDFKDAELNAALPDYATIDRDEKVAWQELSHWADDADIREKDGRYASYKRDRMRHCLELLMATEDKNPLETRR